VKSLTTGSKSMAPVLAVEGVPLGASVLEEFLALGESDEFHGFDSCVGGPQRSVHPADGPRRGPPGVERSSSMPDQHGSRQHRPWQRLCAGAGGARFTAALELIG
jgi:hypothetical protein